jgi:lipocalin
VKELDVERFLGHWYEIARFDHRFERNMEYTEAEYSMRDDGNIDVVNTGIKNGKRKTAKGRAKMTDNPAMLRVSFFRPFYSDYRVMMLDSAYQYALIGSGDSNYLWILARQPQLRRDTKAKIVSEAERRGYDTGKLIWVRQ